MKPENYLGFEKLSDKLEAQAKYCKDNNYPHFAPFGGNCFDCGNQIYDHISLQTASSSLITGCPICHYSYCE